MPDQEQIILNADDGPVRSAVDRANRAVESYGETVIRISDRSKSAIDRVVNSMEKQASTYGKSGIEKLISERDELIKRYQGEQRAVDAINASYEKKIGIEKAAAAATAQAAKESELAARIMADYERKTAEAAAAAEAAVIPWNKLGFAMKDVFEGRMAYGEVRALGFLQSLSGMTLAAGAITAAILALGAASYASMKGIASYGLEMENLHLRTGLALSETEKFAFAAKMAGADVSVYERMMRGLAEASAESSTQGEKARTALKALGVDLRDRLTGELRTTSQVLSDVSLGLNKLPEGFQRDAMAIDLFKRAGVEAIPVAVELASSLRDYEKMGLGSTASLIASGKEYQRTLTEIGERWDRLKLSIMEPLASVWNITLKIGGKAVDIADKSGAWLQTLRETGFGLNDANGLMPGETTGWFGQNRKLSFNLDHLNLDNSQGYSKMSFGVSQGAVIPGHSLATAPPSLFRFADPRTPATALKMIDRLDADAAIDRLYGGNSPERQLKAAEDALNKLAKPEKGKTSSSDVAAYKAAEDKVDALKAQIKATEQYTESLKKLKEAADAMGARELTPVEKLYANRDLALAGVNPNLPDARRLTANTQSAVDRLLDKDEAAQNREFKKENELGYISAQRGTASLFESDIKDGFKAIDEGVKSFLRDAEVNKRLISEADKDQVSRMTVDVNHQARMAELGSKDYGPGAEIAALRQEVGVRAEIRAQEMAVYEIHSWLYDMDDKRNKNEIASLHDRYELEEKILELKNKEFDEVEKTTEKLVNTLLTKPSSFGKELGSTIHAAVLKPIVEGISHVAAGAITPLVYGKDGQSGLSGLLRGGNKTPQMVSLDLNSQITAANTDATVQLTRVLAQGSGGGGAAAPGMPGGASVGSLGSVVTSGSGLAGLGIAGAGAGVSAALSYAAGGVQRQSNRNMIGGVMAGFARPGDPQNSYSPMDYMQRNTWAPGAVAAAGGYLGGSFSSSPGTGLGYTGFNRLDSAFQSEVFGDVLGLNTPSSVGGGSRGGGGGGTTTSGALESGVSGSLKNSANDILKKASSSGIVGSLKGTDWITIHRAQGGANAQGATTSGRITGVGGVAGQALGAGGMALATQGLTGKYMGSTHGIIEGAAGGAMVGMEYGGPIGAAIGAVVGAGIGIGEMLTGTLSPQEKAIKYCKQIYGITISMQMAQQIVQIAQSKYGGNVEVAVRDPSTRQMLQLYATGTGQKFPISAMTPQSGSLAEQGGRLYQQATYQGNTGQAMTFASNLPVAGGFSTQQYPSTPSQISLTLNGQSAADVLEGRVANVATPSFVQGQYQTALNSSDGRMDNSASLQAPGLIIS